MLTLFTTAKPFVGHSEIIQRNALTSWKRLHPDIEIILFGDDLGVADICRELGFRHEPHAQRTDEGTKLLRPIYERAQQVARFDVLCYSNCDIVLGQDFLDAIKKVSTWTTKFLMIGRRWDVDITGYIDFDDPDWEAILREFAFREGFQRLYYNIDYFAFSKALFADIPDLAIGRVWWDQWLVWKAAQQKAAVVDASDLVVAIHQNHDYGYHPDGQQGVWNGEGARRNYEAAGGASHLHTIEDATYRLSRGRIHKNRLYWLAPAKRNLRRLRQFVRGKIRTGAWYPFLNRTRPLRHALGLNSRNIAKPLRRKEAVKRHPLDRWG